MIVGVLASLWRYPVKSMQGESLAKGWVEISGVVGDHVAGFINDDGLVLSAGRSAGQPLMQYRAEFIGDETHSDIRVRVTLPNGISVGLDEPELVKFLSSDLGQAVRLIRRTPGVAFTKISGKTMKPGSLFDSRPIHLVTSASLRALKVAAPASIFNEPRFRPTFFVKTTDSLKGFVENGWVSREIAVGDEVRILVEKDTKRCVVTTLPQGDLPTDPNVLRTVACENASLLGVYATVLQPGVVRVGDLVKILD